jgi:hypothetical protein
MKCWHCNSELIWGSDASFEDVLMEGDGIVSFLSCSNDDCDCNVEVFLRQKKEINET